jgi:[ribosomal protein S5]-alanine N-acetyltransferase
MRKTTRTRPAGAVAPRRKPPTLKTRRLRLTAPEQRHADGLFDYGSREAFTAFIDSAPFRTRKEAERFARCLQADNKSGRRLYWVAELRNGERAVGTLGFIFAFSPRHRVAEFGYGFAPETWGTGLFAEAASAVIAFGFAKLGLRRIQAITRATNFRAIKAVEKLGFRCEAVLAEFYQEPDASRCDAVLLALLAPPARRR